MEKNKYFKKLKAANFVFFPKLFSSSSIGYRRSKSVDVYFNINFKHFVLLEIEIEIFIFEKNTTLNTIVRFQCLSQEEATLSLTYSVNS